MGWRAVKTTATFYALCLQKQLCFPQYSLEVNLSNSSSQPALITEREEYYLQTNRSKI